MKAATKSKVTVAEFIDTQVRLLEGLGKPQFQIAAEAGFNKPNIITMLKQGTTKVPLAKVGPLAKALGVDPMHLFKLVMAEYEPETWAAIEGFMPEKMALSKNEIEIVNTIRESNVPNPKLRSEGDKERLRNFIGTLDSDNGMDDTDVEETRRLIKEREDKKAAKKAAA